MRQMLFASCIVTLLAGAALADELPGPAVQNVAPFNSRNVMLGSNISCQKAYTTQEFATQRTRIVADTQQCVAKYFGIEMDLGLDFGAGSYADCVVPSTYEARPPANNPRWPVCCAILGADDKYRMACRLFFTGR